MRLIDVDGTQVADLFAHAVADSSVHLCTGRTRLANSRLFPVIGESFHGTNYEPLLTLIGDTSPGVHDMLYEACDRSLHELLGGGSNHRNCHDNYLAAAKTAEVVVDRVPSPVNFFQSTPVSGDGQLSAQPAPSNPGDYVELLAVTDVVVIVSACSVDVGTDINGGKSTPLRLEVM